MQGTCIDDNTDALLLEANAVVIAPIALTTRWRVHASGGGGAVYAWIHGAGMYDSSQLHPIADAGLGATFWARPWLGVRIDARWFHAFVDESRPDGGYASGYDWFRLSVGVSFAATR